MPNYINPRTQKTWPLETPLWCAPDDGQYVNLIPGKGLSQADIDTGSRSLWRYRAALRLDSKVSSLGEGFTPLVAIRWADKEIHLKLEYLMPSGSFKDRGTVVMLNYLKQRGVNHILEDSSGNAGASIATYAAYMGMRCRILVPESAPAGKKTQIRAMGAEVVEVRGTREDVTKAALEMAKKLFYAGHNYQPYFLEGTKTLAFELWEQLDFKSPDVVIAPLGQGSNVMGLYNGFSELMTAGQIKKPPKIYGVQALNCAPYFASFQANTNSPVPITPTSTIADGIASFKPVRLIENLQAMRASGGECLAVSESEIIEAHKKLCSQGFYVEPTSAVALAALDRLVQQKKTSDKDCVVLILTGHGLKATDRIKELMDAH